MLRSSLHRLCQPLSIMKSEKMKYKIIAFIGLIFFMHGCSTSSDLTEKEQNSNVIAQLAKKIPLNPISTRNIRNCELFDIEIIDNKVFINVWNNVAQGHFCPDEWLNSIDRNDYIVDGPRWKPIDYMFVVDENMNLLSEGSENLNRNPRIRKVPSDSGLTMMKAASVKIGNLNLLKKKFKIKTDNQEELRTQIQSKIFSEMNKSTQYKVTTVNREFNTFWVYKAGNPIYVLSDGQCEYAMKYYTSSSNPDLTNEEAIKDLNKKFAKLPSGFKFEVRIYDQDIHILDLDNTQYVLTDEFGNSYDRLWCGEKEIPYEIFKKVE